MTLLNVQWQRGNESIDKLEFSTTFGITSCKAFQTFLPFQLCWEEGAECGDEAEIFMINCIVE